MLEEKGFCTGETKDDNNSVQKQFKGCRTFWKRKKVGIGLAEFLLEQHGTRRQDILQRVRQLPAD